MKEKDVIRQSLQDIKVELSEEFDRNFERKAFFDQKWETEKLSNSKGSLMMRTGKTRNSIKSKIVGDTIKWSSPFEYLNIHNEGGTITVTSKMKKFFWAMHLKAKGASGGGSKNRKLRLSTEAKQWKALALMPVGKQMKIPKRQIIGAHPKVTQAIDDILTENITDYLKQLPKIIQQ